MGGERIRPTSSVRGEHQYIEMLPPILKRFMVDFLGNDVDKHDFLQDNGASYEGQSSK